jgi:hypothetical protein
MLLIQRRLPMEEKCPFGGCPFEQQQTRQKLGCLEKLVLVFAAIAVLLTLAIFCLYFSTH